LIQYFEYAESVLGKGVIELRLAGPIDAGFDLDRNTSQHIIYLGILGEIEKQQEIMRASCIVNPSHHESLSLLVLEGIAAERPILVQTSCQVLSDYTKLYETVYGFRTPSDFLNAVKRLIRELDNSECLGLALKHAADQVKTRHSWSLVLQKYADLLPS
jgi:hypothetical protein